MSTSSPQNAGSAVPKFGSFKPKRSAANDGKRVDESELPSEGGESLDASDRAKKEYRRRDEHRSHTYRSRADRHSGDRHHSRSDRDRRKKHDVKRPPKPSLITNDFEESDLFIIDRRGDSKNVEYGSLHRYSVPSYYRKGYGRVVGAPSTDKIDRAESSDKSVVLARVSRDARQRPGSILGSTRGQTFNERSLRVILPGEVVPELEADLEFISLGSGSRKRKRGADSPTHTSSVREDVDYRSIEGNAKPSDEVTDEDLEQVTDSGDEGADRLAQEVRQQNAALVRWTKEHPTDADTWTALIEHQAEVIRPGVDATQLTNQEKHALADIRLSIYEQALKHINKGKVGHADFVLRMVEQGSQIWETSRLTAKWVEVLKENPDDITIWTRYLNFVQTNHIAFRYEQCRDAYLQCLAILLGSRATASESMSQSIAQAQLYILLRLTTFIRDAGYDEQAYAIWQALLEYHRFAPASVPDQQAKLKALEEFWDSDRPRIGEESAQGWAVYVERGHNRARSVTTSERPQLDVLHPFLSFADHEMKLQKKLHLPATIDDDTAADDPFRFVMFPDLRPCVEPLLDGLPERAMLNAFLAFVGLPQLPDHAGATPKWQIDQFLASRSDSTMSNRLGTTFGLFRDAFDTTLINKQDPALTVFVDRALGLLVSAQPHDEDLTEYYIAQKLAFFPNEAVKATKRLLKARPTSLRLYNAYAVVESKLGRKEKAVEAWSTALEMSSSFADGERHNAVLLWHSWTFTLFQQERSGSQALQRLLAMCDGAADTKDLAPVGVISASQRLRVAQTCEAGWERMIYNNHFELAVLYAECHMLFAYLADDETLHAAVDQRKKYSARLAHQSMTSSNELLLQAQAEFMKLHIDRHCPYKPAALRAELIESLRVYPDNSVLLGCYLRLGALTRIDDRIRASLQDDLLTGPKATVVGCSFAIEQELRRCTSESAGSTDHAVRSLFARALLSPDSAVKHSVGLWRQWFAFELPSRHEKMQSSRPLGDTQRQQALQRAKQVFLDGLRYLPWRKAWVITGLQAFAKEGAMTSGELRRVYDVLGERELRVMMPVEEMEKAVAGL